MDLDETLNAAAPPLAPRTPQLRTELHSLVTRSNAAATRSNKRLKVGVTSILALTAGFGGYTVAAANGLVPPVFGWGSNTGAQCVMDVEFYAHDDMGGEQMSRNWPYPIQIATRDAANTFAATYDFSGIDMDQAVQDFRDSEHKVIQEQPDPNERQPYAETEQAEHLGVLDVFYDDLREHLENKNLPMETIVSASGWNCES